MLFTTFFVAGVHATIRAQDSAFVEQRALIDRLVEHNIISETARASMLKWMEFLRSDQAEMTAVYAHQQVSRPVIQGLALGAQAYRTLQWYHYVADSLHRTADPRGTNKRSMSMRQRASAVDVIYMVSGQHEEPPPRTDLGPEVIQWIADDPGFAQAVKDLGARIGYAHASLYTSTRSPASLIDTLKALNLLDDVLAQELLKTQECGQLYDGAAVLMRAGQLIHDRDWQSLRRLEVEQRASKLTERGFMDETRRAALWKHRGPYEWPSDFEIAMASAPHVVFTCDQRELTAENYYQEHLRKLSGVIPELSLTEVQVERREADSSVVRGGYELLVSFMNNGRGYAFRTYDGGIVRSGDRPRPCFMMFHALTTLNKALCDAHSNYRVLKFEYGEGECGWYETTSMCLAFIDMTRCGIWWPDQEQKPGTSGMLAEIQRDKRCEDLFSTKYSADSIAALIGRMRSIGMLAHLSEPQIDSATVAANMTMPRAWDDVLSCFPDMVAHPYDGGHRRDTGSYTEELERLADITHGAVRIERVRERWDRRDRSGSVLMGFSVNGQRIDMEPGATSPYDVVDEMIIRINHALTQHGASGRFCAVLSDRDLSIAFLTKAQYEALRDNVVRSYFDDPWAAELPEYMRHRR